MSFVTAIGPATSVDECGGCGAPILTGAPVYALGESGVSEIGVVLSCGGGCS